jgi:HSP20 family protein
MASRFIIPFGGGGLAGRSDPFLSLHREMNRLFDDTFRTFGQNEGGQGGMPSMVPQLDVQEKDGEFCLTADLPGVAESDIDLTVEGDVLTIRGEKKNQRERDERGYHIMERSSGSFLRTLRLPFEPDPEKVNAEYRDGVLTVHVPKEGQQQRTRRIEVRRAGAGQGDQRTIEGTTSAANNDERQLDHQEAASQGSMAQAGGSDDTGQSEQVGGR